MLEQKKKNKRKKSYLHASFPLAALSLTPLYGEENKMFSGVWIKS